MKHRIQKITKPLVGTPLSKAYRLCLLVSLVMNVCNWPQLELTSAKSNPVK